MARTRPVPQPELVNKLEWLMFFRVLLITLLLGSALALDFNNATPLRRELARLIVGTYVVTIAYALMLKRMSRGFVQFAYVQLVVDMALTAVVIALTGGTDSVFVFMYSLTVLSAAFLLFRRGATYISAVAVGLIVLQVAREATGWMMPQAATEPELRGILLSGLSNISAVFFVTLLSGYLSEQLRDAGQRLQLAGQDLAALRALNEHIITSVKSGLVSYTLDRRIIFFNPAAERITGREAPSVLFGRIDELFPSLADRSIDGQDDRFEAPYTRPDGAKRMLGMSQSRLLDNHGAHKGWILIFQDLTPLREMRDAVQRAEKFAAIGRMAAGIAHEIRNPLASMSGSIQMLQRATKVDPMSQRLMGIVQREADRLDRLVTDFLRFARPGPPDKAQLDLRTLLEDIAAVFANRDGDDEARHELVLSLDGDLHLAADAHQLQQVIWNLLNNAADSMPEGGRIDLIARHLPADADEGARVGVQVVDRGAGIDPEHLSRIFDPFYTTKADGTGLGLAVAQRIIEDHEGHLRAESDEGRGSTFILTLPVVPRLPVLPTEPPALEPRL